MTGHPRTISLRLDNYLLRYSRLTIRSRACDWVQIRLAEANNSFIACILSGCPWWQRYFG